MLYCNISYEAWNILPQSSGDLDPEAHPELKKPVKSSEISIWRSFRKPHILIRTKTISRNYTKKKVINDQGSLILDS